MDRRKFLKTTLFAGAGLAATSWMPCAWAQLGIADPARLRITTRTLDVNGKAASVYGLIGPNGKSGLRLKEGDIFAVDLVNTLSDPTMIHWHGILSPYEQDGVPDMPMPLLKAGETRSYSFPVGNAGTHWMHAHTLQEQNLLAAPLIVGASKQADEQEIVILLHDFSFTPAAELLAKLQKGSTSGIGQNMNHEMAGIDGASMGDMPAMEMDLNDIEYDAYLANDRTLGDPEVVQVEKGGRIRLRVINGATSTVFTIDTGTLEGELVSVDGHDVAPLRGGRFQLAMGQRADIRLTIPQDSRAFPILALREGSAHRTGIILAPKGARIEKLAVEAEQKGPEMGFGLESKLIAAHPLNVKTPDRTINAMLMGDMATYQWSLTADRPLKVREGERVAINIANHTMMGHPIHLHGHKFQVVSINGKSMQGAVRDTVHIPPMGSVGIAFDAANKGKWAFHCHHLYHMATGMMQMLEYEEV
ncbi:MAG: multicopper oxidase family protein [Alphaproteobacteria bacterium]|nr:multicopper oxidase family protein [Alphaproteobacteria bacterium]